MTEVYPEKCYFIIGNNQTSGASLVDSAAWG